MRLTRLFGIDIVVDISWLFVFALVAWSLSQSAGPFHAVAASSGERALLAVVAALLFFASVLLHELAHSLVARANGIPITEIRLFIFGGVSRFAAEPKTAPSAAWIALVGPLASIGLAVLAAGGAAALGITTPIGAMLEYLAAANGAVGVFNLLPAFPLDGGRVLQSVIWAVTHDRLHATKIAVRIGAVLAWLLIGAGVAGTLAYGFGGALWYTFIGWFLLQAGKSEETQAQLDVALVGHTALQLSTPAAAILPADALADAALRTMMTSGSRALPVALHDQFLGIVTIADIAHTSGDDLAHTYVTALMKRAETLKTLAPGDRAETALKMLGETGYHQLPVVDADGTFLGFVTREGVIAWLTQDRDPAVQAVLRRR